MACPDSCRRPTAVVVVVLGLLCRRRRRNLLACTSDSCAELCELALWCNHACLLLLQLLMVLGVVVAPCCEHHVCTAVARRRVSLANYGALCQSQTVAEQSGSPASVDV